MLRTRIIAPLKIEYVHTEIPACGVDEVLVKLHRVGICASDIQVYHGQHKYVTYPLVQGHEGCGAVIAVGNRVSHVKTGDLVAVQPQIACGECFACKQDRFNVCENLRHFGISREGLLQEYAAVPSWNAVKIPEGMPPELGALVEPISVAVNAVRKGNVQPGYRVVVLGAGIIGNFVAQAARQLGAEVILTDIQSKRLDLARSHGLEHCINTQQTDLKDEITRVFGDQGVHVIFDCAAVPASLEQALNCASKASTIVIVGNYKAPVEFDMTRIQRREIALLSVMGCSRSNFLESLDWLSKGRINVTGMITKVFPFSELDKAYAYIDQNTADTMKVMVGS